MNKYEISFTFFICLDSSNCIARKDELLDSLDKIPEIVYYDTDNDGEDWCIDCIANIYAETIGQVDEKLCNVLKSTNCVWDYHYIDGVDTDEYWQP